MEKGFNSLIFKDIKELGCEKSFFENKLSLTFKKINDLVLASLSESLDVDLLVDENVHLTLIFHPKKKVLLNFNTTLKKNSSCKIVFISNNSSSINHVSNCAQSSNIEVVNLALSSINSSNKIMLAEKASCILVNNYFSNDISNVKDVVIHKGNNSSSLIKSNGYLLNSKAEYKGLIKIESGAFESVGEQKSHILLEGDSGAVSVPDLEILNNDVKCSHGAITSRIKDEDLFYFESRGISKKEARDFLIKSHLLANIFDNNIKRICEDFFIEAGV